MNAEKQQESPLVIRTLSGSKDISAFWNLLEKGGLAHDREYYERCLERSEMQEMDVILAFLRDSPGGEETVGFCLMNWQPKYALFKKTGIPEIQDLNVLKTYRRRGFGRDILVFCEGFAREKGHQDIGIGVGLDSRFGAAQRLYARMSYIPDGSGVSYDRKQVACGEMRPIDENLCLMMTKPLF